jgi:hypothetical protein
VPSKNTQPTTGVDEGVLGVHINCEYYGENNARKATPCLSMVEAMKMGHFPCTRPPTDLTGVDSCYASRWPKSPFEFYLLRCERTWSSAFDSFDLEDDWPEPIGAAGNGRAGLFYRSQIPAGGDGFDFAADISPGPGAKTLRRLVPHIYLELLPIAEAVAGADPAIYGQILIGDIRIDASFKNGDLAFRHLRHR